MPETMEQACQWITTLRDAFNREHQYVERLERRHHLERDVVYWALEWRRARGMHIAGALARLKAAANELQAREKAGEYSIHD